MLMSKIMTGECQEYCEKAAFVCVCAHNDIEPGLWLHYYACVSSALLSQPPGMVGPQDQPVNLLWSGFAVAFISVGLLKVLFVLIVSIKKIQTLQSCLSSLLFPVLAPFAHFLLQHQHQSPGVYTCKVLHSAFLAFKMTLSVSFTTFLLLNLIYYEASPSLAFLFSLQFLSSLLCHSQSRNSLSSLCQTTLLSSFVFLCGTKRAILRLE